MDFKNFCEQNQNICKEKVETTFKEKTEDINDIKEQINNYSGKSQDELLNEFMTLSKNMNIDDNKINQITNQIGPLLNQEQREKMQKLLNQIRK